MNKSIKIKISLLIYSFFMTYLHSFNSIRFDDSSIYSDNAVFYLMGRGILRGQVLYKDMYDHKPPYIFLLNAIAAIFEKNHMGLYIITSLILFISLYYTYKIIKLFINDDCLSLTGSCFICLFLNTAELTLGFLRTEGYAVALLLTSAYLFLNFFINGNTIFNLKHMFIIGILAGLTLSINIKSCILYVPFAISTLVVLLKNKNIQNAINCFFVGISGVIISIIPNFIYLIINDCFYEGLDAIFRVNGIYALPYTNIASDNETLIQIILKVIKMHPIITIIILLELICIIIYKTKTEIKLPVLFSFILCLIYTILVNRPYTYYYTIFIPYLIPLYLFLINLINFLLIKIKLSTKMVSLIIISLLFLINIPLGFFEVNNRYKTNTLINNSVHELLNNKIEITDDTKILSYGFYPEYYMFLNKNLHFPYFIIPNIRYKYYNTAYRNQVNYIRKGLPDVLIITFGDYVADLPSNYYNMLREAIAKKYEYVGDINIFEDKWKNPNVFIKR